MREILFRGKTQQPCGEWIYGSLLTDYPLCKNEVDETVKFHYIVDGKAKELKKVKVIPETVGQYTGLTDKNGKKIFEGDIIRGYGVTGKVDFKKGLVWWDALFSQWRTNKECLYGSKQCATYRVLGNIHDNPELLKGGADE